MRRLLLVNALIFAVLAAVVAFAYFGWANSSAVALQDEQQKLLDALALEKRLNIESNVAEADNRILKVVRLDQVDKLDEQVRSTGAAVASVFVLDDELKPVLNGSISTSRPQAEAVKARDWYVAHEISKLDFAKLPLEKAEHHYGTQPDGTPYLLSYERKLADGKSYYVVVEDDLNHLLNYMIPQFFLGSGFLYQVVDDRGALRQGWPFNYEKEALRAEVEFTMLDHWRLRLAEGTDTAAKNIRDKKIVDGLLLGGAVAIILVGLGLLAIAIRRERRSNELKSDFISNVSHELKTPLAIISMFGEMLANKKTKSPEQATEYAEIIWRESVRLGRLIDNVLDFAKIERGMGVYEFAESDVVEVVERAIDLANRRLQAANMTLEAHIGEDIPPIQLDANAFTLAVLNLVDNAIKYAADGKKIELSLRREGERVVLAVKDFGPGIPLEEQTRIFERFYRAKEMRLKPIRGSGIGLALVQHIARAHGGDITVESTPGNGATFQLWLPI